ncbi:MAG: GntR family transcriptional regulator [Nocardioides sp.]|nr:GntR family transcriptional regulator [Nocardioides sp.]|tara:strand:- start:1214 stop:1894 length:681 start_codon:yes stop_codon:yes gene_type:complete
MSSSTEVITTGRLESPGLVKMAADAIRRKILSGQLQPGQRLIEERLTEELAISRPPLREALRLLETEGIIERLPRRGAFVKTLSDQDAHEVVVLRAALERLAFETGIPVSDEARLEPARRALEEMERCARDEDRGALVEAGYRFHSALVKIAGNRQLEQIYASVQQKILLCMARNLVAREKFFEDLPSHAARHRELLEIVASGDRTKALEALAAHGEDSFELARDA